MEIGVLPERYLLMTMTVNASSELRWAANAASRIASNGKVSFVKV